MSTSLTLYLSLLDVVSVFCCGCGSGGGGGGGAC